MTLPNTIECNGPHDLSSDFNALYENLYVLFFCQIIGIYNGRIKGIVGAQSYRSSALGVQQRWKNNTSVGGGERERKNELAYL